MTDPTFELMAATISRLKVDAAIRGYCSGRVYDRPPDGAAVSPYITVSVADVITDDADCIDGLEVSMQIDCYSWGAGEAFSSVEVRKLSGLVRASLHEAEFDLADNALAMCRHRITRYQREDDGTINRAIITIEAFVEVND